MRTNLTLSKAMSMNNGICFYSNRHKGYIAIATIDEQDNIKAEWTTMKKYQKNKDKNEKIAEIKKNFKLFLLLLLFSGIFSILLFNWALKKSFTFGIRFFLIGFPLVLLALFIVITNRERKKEENSYKFHSAEHMVINACRKLRRVPSLEEIHQYSRFYNYCGTNATTQFVIFFILAFACSFIPNPLYKWICSLSGTAIVFILQYRGCLNFLQRFTTIPPTDKELIVSIAGMNVWFENEKKEKKKSKFQKFLHRLFPGVLN